LHSSKLRRGVARGLDAHPRREGGIVPGNRPTTIVRTGPYRYSRNPIYLSFSLFQLGVAIWVSSLWILVSLVAAVALMSFVVTPREERYLEGRFPSKYSSCRNSVRRWLRVTVVYVATLRAMAPRASVLPTWTERVRAS
jgi:protein-S-isoprenylcysteine O-methyltransferase Ste14